MSKKAPKINTFEYRFSSPTLTRKIGNNQCEQYKLL